MKGITPIIAIILLLLITVSMAGFAFVFLQRTLEQTTTSTETGLQNQLDQQGQTFAIDNIDDVGNMIAIRHTGSTASDTSKISVYIDDVLQSCTWNTPGAWVPGGGPRTCTVAAFACPKDVRITSPGNTDSTSC